MLKCSRKCLHFYKCSYICAYNNCFFFWFELQQKLSLSRRACAVVRKLLSAEYAHTAAGFTSGVRLSEIRDVKSSRPKWPRGQKFGIGLGLGLKALASALALNIWPRLCLGLQQKNQQPRIKRQLLVLLLQTCKRSDDRRQLLCEREWEIN